MEFWQVIRGAVRDAAQPVALILGCGVQQVYRQCKPSLDVTRRNVYERFWRFAVAIHKANPAGFWFLINDVWARAFELEHGEAIDESMLVEILRRRNRERAETADALLAAEDWDEIEREILEDRVEDEYLLAWVRRHRLNRPVETVKLLAA